MTLTELVKKTFKNDRDPTFVAVASEYGIIQYVEFADELCETHGDRQVAKHAFVPEKNWLVVVF